MAAVTVTEGVPTIVCPEKTHGICSLAFHTSDLTIIHDALSSLVYAGFMTATAAKHLQTPAIDAAGMGSKSAGGECDPHVSGRGLTKTLGHS
jgi:hypothetical protein